jgi:hypothetical protein
MRRCSWALTLRCSWPYLLATRPPDSRKPGARPGLRMVQDHLTVESSTSRFLMSRFLMRSACPPAYTVSIGQTVMPSSSQPVVVIPQGSALD